jgi:RNA polymerase sigma-70 factor (ECF subfamily)
LAALVQRWRRHGPPDCPAAFVFAVARRRSFRLTLQRRLMEPLHLLLERPSPSPGPEERAAARGELGRALAALRRLPGRDREALLLVGVGDLGPTEGAKVLGISVSAFKMRIHRARQRLSRVLEGDSLEEGDGTAERAREESAPGTGARA